MNVFVCVLRNNDHKLLSTMPSHCLSPFSYTVHRNYDTPCTVKKVNGVYRKRGSNPHGRNVQGILSPSCLPFHHSGIRYVVQKKEVQL